MNLSHLLIWNRIRSVLLLQSFVVLDVRIWEVVREDKVWMGRSLSNQIQLFRLLHFFHRKRLKLLLLLLVLLLNLLLLLLWHLFRVPIFRVSYFLRLNYFMLLHASFQQTLIIVVHYLFSYCNSYWLINLWVPDIWLFQLLRDN